MGNRGRKSADSLLIAASPIQSVERQRPPHELTDEEVEVWASVVACEPADWFSASTRPLLAQYCRHVVQARRVAELIERATGDPNLDVRDYQRLLHMQDVESKAIMLLATKMRLCQQSTTNHRGNPKRQSTAKNPWEG
jgi:hypothetical protein